MQETNPSAFVETKTAQTHAQELPRHHSSVLFQYEPHQPRNVNRLQEAEQAASGFNTRVAVALTKGVGTMWTAYAFVVLAIIGLCDAKMKIEGCMNSAMLFYREVQ